MKTTTQSILINALFPNKARSYKILGSHWIITLLSHRGKFLEGESFVRKGEAGGWRKYFTQVLPHNHNVSWERIHLKD